MRSPARLVTGTAAAALSAVALGLAIAPSAHAEGPVARPESSAWPAPRTDPGTDSGTGSGVESAPEDTEPGTETEPTGTELTETELTDTDAATGARTETEPDTGARPRPEPVKPPPGTKPVPVTPSAPPARTWPERPSGHVRTGVGGSAGPDTIQLAAGAGVLGAAAVGGAWLLRRRRADGAQDG